VTDGETLFLVLALLYLSDCLLWIRNQSVAFVSPWRRTWHTAFGNWFLGNERGSLFILNPLPVGQIFLADLPPISLSTTGVCDFNPQSLFRLARAPRPIRECTFDQMNNCRTDGAYLLINHERFAKCATAAQAQMLADVINETRAGNLSERKTMVRDYFARQFDLKAATATLDSFRNLTRPVRSLCFTFFLFLFVATPVLVNIYGLLRLILPLIIATVGFALIIAVEFFLAHRTLYRARSTERITDVIKMVLCPPVAIRVSDLLGKHLLSDYSPVVLATLFPGKATDAFTRNYLRDLQHPLAYDVTGPEVAQIVSEATAMQLELCLEYLKRNTSSEAGALDVPPAQNADSAFYCPRCHGQFLRSSGDCPDCPGVGLRAFAESHDSRTGD